jgi:hypothetical protein
MGLLVDVLCTFDCESFEGVQIFFRRTTNEKTASNFHRNNYNALCFAGRGKDGEAAAARTDSLPKNRRTSRC